MNCKERSGQVIKILKPFSLSNYCFQTRFTFGDYSTRVLIYRGPPISDANSHLKAFQLKDLYIVTFGVVVDANLNKTTAYGNSRCILSLQKGKIKLLKVYSCKREWDEIKLYTLKQK